jgi:hypothetical protein
MPDEGLSCGNEVPSRRCRSSSLAERAEASRTFGMYFAGSRPLSVELSSCRRSFAACSLSSQAPCSLRWRISHTSKHGFETAKLISLASASARASGRLAWLTGHSTSNTHQNSSTSSFSLTALRRASMARLTRVSGTAPESACATWMSTAAASRTSGSSFNAFRYSGSVRSPSQKTSRVFLMNLVATFRRKGRPPGVLLLEVMSRCPSRG